MTRTRRWGCCACEISFSLSFRGFLHWRPCSAFAHRFEACTQHRRAWVALGRLGSRVTPPRSWRRMYSRSLRQRYTTGWPSWRSASCWWVRACSAPPSVTMMIQFLSFRLTGISPGVRVAPAQSVSKCGAAGAVEPGECCWWWTKSYQFVLTLVNTHTHTSCTLSHTHWLIITLINTSVHLLRPHTRMRAHVHWLIITITLINMHTSVHLLRPHTRACARTHTHIDWSSPSPSSILTSVHLLRPHLKLSQSSWGLMSPKILLMTVVKV